MKITLNALFVTSYFIVANVLGPIANVPLYFYIINMRCKSEAKNRTMTIAAFAIGFLPYFLYPFTRLSETYAGFWKEVENAYLTVTAWSQYEAKWSVIAELYLSGHAMDPSMIADLHRYMLLHVVSSVALGIACLVSLMRFDVIYNSFFERAKPDTYIPPKFVYLIAAIPAIIILLYYYPLNADDDYRRKAIALWGSAPSVTFTMTLVVACFHRYLRLSRR